MQVRVAAAKVIATTLKGDASLAVLIPDYQTRVKDRDRALLQELCFGTLRNFHKLNAIAGKLLQKPLKAKDADVLALLCCGLYQLTSMRIPPHAAISESVQAASGLNKTWAKGLVNGILRRYQRENAGIIADLAKDADYITSHPAWLRELIQTAWPNQTKAIFAANNSRPPFTLRVNTRQTSRENYANLLQQANIGCKLCDNSDTGITLTQAMDVSVLPGFSDGWVSVQDEAAQLAAGWLDLQPGQRILDACCAPGGKTCHILEAEPELGEVVALDVDSERLQRVRDNLNRLHLEATLVAADAANTTDWWDNRPFDRILLDAPCSGTGVIRRHPDIKVLRRPEDIDKLAAIQTELLQALWPLLKEDGLLLYATCSILPQENSVIITRFVQQQTDARIVPLPHWQNVTATGQQLFPQIDGHDGFYYALLKKRGRESAARSTSDVLL